MATRSCILAWEIPSTEEPGRLRSMGSQSQTPLSDETTTTNCCFLESFYIGLFGHSLTINDTILISDYIYYYIIYIIVGCCCC